MISHQAVFNTNAYIMLYELESSPFTPKSAVNKAKPSLSPQPISNGNTSKTITNGISFTSDKVYGPELPPNRFGKKPNGIQATTTNGNGNCNLSENSSTSDSETENTLKTPQKDNKNGLLQSLKKSAVNTHNETKSPLTQKVVNRTLPSSSQNKTNNINTKQVSLSTNTESTKTKETVLSSVPTKLVPYETDDSSCSDESNQSPHEVDYRVSTKAAVGEWQITSAEPQTKSWGEKKEDNVVSELYKMSHSGYSAPIASWNGNRAQLDKEISAERREDRKRSFIDSAEHGRVKHQKLNNSYKSNPGYNPVQVSNINSRA